ncbi:ABC transporter ATP-binding protein [Anaerotruncus massiliensis (ex Togo et al. 2019)]|uniref:ABC transporter ATP-binding protein n=1 Tax=Anaerotruncus massiliensis (ex Togo et al. 2019) TaxID=1673720 RepID=UPI0027BAF5CF|nr:ABC transporter ATP-binding protein [Anaerotruncus massiliensis (ex Togo et al. 2019)]
MAVLKDTIIIKDLAKTFYLKSETKEVLKDINITVKENEFLVLLGPGQCGKTVLLNILAGLDVPTGGEITFVNGRPPMGDLGVVFQRYALFPWKTVMGNVEINQKFKGKSKAERQAAAQKYIELVGLQGFENSLPKQLSGGMQQRVGIARAYASESDIMLLDEPFGALDAQTRYSMEDEILRIWEKDRRTVIFVTNNVEEAIYLGDRIILLGGHPTGVKKEYVPDLPRPRNYTDPAFLKLRNEIVANTDLVL